MPKSCKYQSCKTQINKTKSANAGKIQARAGITKSFFKEQEMSIFTRLLLGSAALAGVGYAGYKAKKHLDSQMEKPENYGLGYKDVAFEEAGKIICNGLGAITEGLAKGYEKIFDEPLYAEGVMSSLDTLKSTLRKSECKHLNGMQLAPALVKKTSFSAAQCSRIGIPIYDEEMDKLNTLHDEIQKNDDFIDAIYELESQCYKAHKTILDFVSFAKDMARDSSDTDTIKGLDNIYSVASSKYDLDEVGEIESVKSAIKSIKESCDRLATLNAELKSSLKDSALQDSHHASKLSEALELATALDGVIRGDFASYGSFCSERVETLQQSA